MRDLNRVEVIGTIAEGYNDNPAVNIGPAGPHTKATFTVITGAERGGKRYETYIRVVAWNDATKGVKGARSGDRVYVEGSWRNDSYEDNEGNKKRTTEVNAYIVELMSASPQQAPPTDTATQSVSPTNTPKDDDLPF